MVETREFQPAGPELLQRVRQMTAGRVPTPTSAHATPPTHTPKDLKSCPYVFIRVDKVTTPLASKYTGPHKVVERSERAFKLDFGVDANGKDRKDWVTLERLKPAHIDTGATETGSRKAETRAAGATARAKTAQG